MTCRDISELLSSYLDGELDPGTRSSVERHLKVCDECTAALAEIRQVRSALRSLPELKPPARLHVKVMDAVLKVRDSEQSTEKASTVKRFRDRFKISSGRFGGFKTLGLVLAACLVIIIISSAGTMFFAKRFDFLGTTEGIAETTQSAEPRLGSADVADTYEQPPQQFHEMSSEDLGSAPPVLRSEKFMGTDLPEQTGTVFTERKLIKRARLTLEVSREKVEPVSLQSINAVKSYQGYIESSSMSKGREKGDATIFSMTARVPSEHLEQAINEISTFGALTRSDMYVDDVTDQYVDIDARIRNKTVQEQRLLKIMGEAKTVGELLQVEGELSRVRADLESMKGRQAVLEKSSAMSFLSLDIVEEGTQRYEPTPWDDIWKTFVRAWQKLFMFTAKIAPAVIVLSLGYLGVMLVLRSKRI